MSGVRRETRLTDALVVEPPEGRLARLAEAQHGVVTREQLLHHSFSDSSVRRRVAAGSLHRIHRGVYAVGHGLLTQRGARMAAVLAAGKRALLSFWDAAALWDLSPFGSGLIHVTVPTAGGRAQRDTFVIHRSRLHPEDRAMVDGIPATSVARTLLDLAGLVSEPRLRRLYSEADRLELLDTFSLIALLERSNGRRGTGRLRALLDDDLEPHAHADSELERLFLDLLRRAGLPLPRTNVLVEGLLVDCFWPGANLVVELDGFRFHRHRDAFERDRARDARLKRAGYEVVRFTYRQLATEPEVVMATVRDLLNRAAGA